MLTSEIKKYIDKSVLCWLATATPDGVPNVSPKEVFTYFEEAYIIIANIASPQSVRNIQNNPDVCIGFINIFIQKGFQVKGKAEIINKTAPEYNRMKDSLLHITKGKYPFPSITKVLVEQTKNIIAPKYFLYPETTEKQQIESAMETYGMNLKD